MDFGLIEKHPWATTGIVLGGGVLLFVVMRRGGSSSAAPAGYAAGSSGTDPNAAALAAQQNQTAAYLSSVQLQGATSISLAKIGADVSMFTTGKTADTINTQTAAQLALGLGTQNAVVRQTEINAGLQGRYIDAIIAAFTGHSSPVVVPQPIGVPTPGSTNPTFQTDPRPTYVIPGDPLYGSGNGPSFGAVNPGTSFPGMPQPGDAPRPGGSQLLPSYSVPHCDPRDVSCVMNNEATAIHYYESVNQAQSTNNRNQCLANAELSRGFANYGSLVSACG